jgi:solute carrier family 10 (sodium/bile acid cotransporter), member 7
MRSFLAKHWFLFLLCAGVFIAMLTPDAMRPFTAYLEPRSTIAISLFLMAWTMPTATLFAEFKLPMASLWAIFLSYGVMPICAWGVGFLAPDEDIQIGLILMSAVPCTLASAVLWTRMAGGNEATALLTVMGTTFSSWILTTAWLYFLTPKTPRFDVLAVTLDLVVSLMLPVVLGQLMRWPARTALFAERHKVFLSALSQCFVLAIVVKAGVTVGDRLQEGNSSQAPMIFLSSIVLANGLHLVILGGGLLSGRWLGFDRGRRIAIGFAASQKTLQVSLVLYDQYYKQDYPYAVMPLLFYHVGQLLLDTLIAQRLLKSAQAPPPSNTP